MAISANIGQGYSSGGSAQSAYNYNNSMSQNWSQANSWTDAMSARQWSAMQAEIAWNRDMYAMEQQMGFNAEEAQKQRDWQERMANTIYTRSVANMREAGINPILAANMGLSGAAVGSGATASLGGVPSAPLAQSFMDSYSASNAHGYGMSNGEGWSEGNSWNYSENGLATAIGALGTMLSEAYKHVTSGQNINITYEGLKDVLKHQKEYNSDVNEWGYQKGKEFGDKLIKNGGVLGQIVQLGRNIVEDVTGKKDLKEGGHKF